MEFGWDKAIYMPVGLLGLSFIIAHYNPQSGVIERRDLDHAIASLAIPKEDAEVLVLVTLRPNKQGGGDRMAEIGDVTGPYPGHPHALTLRLTVDFTVKPAHYPMAAISDQRDFADLTGFETHRRSGRDIKPESPRGLSVEIQRGVGFKEMIMRAYLNRAVAGIGNPHRSGFPSGVKRDLACGGDDFSWNHRLFFSLNGWGRGR